MFENGLILSAKGNPFREDSYTKFTLLEKHQQNLKNDSTVIYGRNGSGKTTIGNLLYNKFKNFEDENIEVKDLNDEPITKEKFERIFIYNERFIDENVKFKENGLDTIVLLGEDALVDEKLIEKKEELVKLEEKIELIKIEKYNDTNSHHNPQTIYNSIIESLKKDGEWATRKQKIDGLSRKATVKSDVLDRIINSSKIKRTTDEFYFALKKYNVLKQNNSECKLELNYCELKLRSNCDELLDKVLNKAIDDDLSLKIYDVIENSGISRIDEINLYMNSDEQFCPFCFKHIESDYKKTIVNKIKKIISKDKKELLDDLNKLKLNTYILDELPDIILLEKKEDIRIKTQQYNEQVDLFNSNVELKKENLYSKPLFQEEKAIFCGEQLNIAISEINALISTHNIDLKNIKPIKKSLEEINDSLSLSFIKDDYKKYLKLLEERDIALKEFNEIILDIKSIKYEIKELEGKKGNFNLAVDEINESLASVFCSNDRLNIELDGDNYIVKCKGSTVELSKLSTGE